MYFKRILLKMLVPGGELISHFRLKYNRLSLLKTIDNGMKVGQNVYIDKNIFFDPTYPYLIEIGDNCRIAMGTIILAHDATIFRHLGITRIAPVRILEGSFIGVNSVILPGVTIGPNALVAAGSVVNRDIGENKIAAGNPARPYANFSDLIDKFRAEVPISKVFLKKDLESGALTPKEIVGFLENNKVAFMHGVPKYDPCYVNVDMNEIRNAAINSFSEAMN